MADLYQVSLVAQALSAAATKTLIQIVAPAQRKLIVVEFSVSFDGSTATAPIRVRLLRQTSAGTFGNTPTPVLWNDPDEGTSQATAQSNASAEPTAGDVLGAWQVAANNGLLVIQYPLGREPIVGKSGRLGIDTLTPTGVSPNATSYIVWAE